jgi:hypothetical protein
VGKVFLYSGAHDNVLIREWTGEQVGDNFGSTLQSGPDCDGDGRDDLLIGANMNGRSPFGPGKAYVFSSGSGTQLRSWAGTSPGDYSSFIARMGDVNGDGFEDIGIGSERFSGPSGVRAGKLDVYSGRNLGRLLATIQGTHAEESLGATNNGGGAVYAGDLNDDGYADFAVPSVFFDGPAGVGCGRVQIFAGDPFTAGVTKYGFSSPSLSYSGKPLALSVTSIPALGNTAFSVTCINVPPNYLGIPVGALQAATTPIQYQNVFILLDLTGVWVWLPAVLPNAPGRLEIPVPLPPGYVGPAIHAQIIFVALGAAGPTLLSSNALHF